MFTPNQPAARAGYRGRPAVANRSVGFRHGAAVALGGLLAMAPAALQAQTQYPLPAHPVEFSTAASRGLADPFLIVGFNPQPDPPGDIYTPNMTNPYDPSITQPGTGEFTIFFSLFGSPTDPYSYQLPNGGPNSDGIFSFYAQGDGHAYLVNLMVTGNISDWVTFNPQPDPPIGGFGIAFYGDPTISWNIDEGFFNQNGTFIPESALQFAVVPEPASLALLAVGLLGFGLTRRRKA